MKKNSIKKLTLNKKNIADLNQTLAYKSVEEESKVGQPKTKCKCD